MAAPRNLRGLLQHHGEGEFLDGSEHSPKSGMLVERDIANAVKSEFDWARRRTERACTRREVERLISPDLCQQRLNVLTVSQKTQLRRLAAEDPDRWTPRMLAPAFGVTPDAVRRLLHSSWLPTSPEEVARHDAKVANRRAKLGLAPPSDQHQLTVSSPPTETTPRYGLRALVERFSAPPPAETPRQQQTRAPAAAVSAVYSRREVLQFNTSDDDGRPVDMRRIGVKVRVPGRHMTLKELKIKEKKVEEIKRLKRTRPGPEI